MPAGTSIDTATNLYTMDDTLNQSGLDVTGANFPILSGKMPDPKRIAETEI